MQCANKILIFIFIINRLLFLYLQNFDRLKVPDTWLRYRNFILLCVDLNLPMFWLNAAVERLQIPDRGRAEIGQGYFRMLKWQSQL